MTLQTTALASALVAGAPACTDAAPADDSTIGEGPGGKSDWAQQEGERRPDLISFTGDAWSECRDHSSRAGCVGYEMFFKVMVTPVQGVEPTAKKVGIVFRSIDNSFAGERTATGNFFTTAADGREEWHVPVRVFTHEDLVKFTVWYQPGNSKTYFDDNSGEGHVFANNNATQVIQTAFWENTVVVSDSKVKGTIRVRVADLDFDKVLGMHATVDGWATTIKLGMGGPGEKNKFYWVEDSFSNTEFWQIDLDLDGVDIKELRYAVFYDHGVVGNARRYTFWDNNWGSDYRVLRGSGGGTRG
jgi:hypothetical protein